MDVRGTSPSDTPDHARDRSSVGWPRRMPFHGANWGSHRRGWSHGTRWIRDARGCGFGCGSDGASSLVRLYTGMPIDRNCARVVPPPWSPLWSPPGCTHSGQKESPADLTVATSEIAGESPILRRNAKSVSGTRRASTKGPRADVGGRREGAYRHCVHGMLPIRHDFWHGRGAN
jgi:hypothetical protein